MSLAEQSNLDFRRLPLWIVGYTFYWLFLNGIAYRYHWQHNAVMQAVVAVSWLTSPLLSYKLTKTWWAGTFSIILPAYGVLGWGIFCIFLLFSSFPEAGYATVLVLVAGLIFAAIRMRSKKTLVFIFLGLACFGLAGLAAWMKMRPNPSMSQLSDNAYQINLTDRNWFNTGLWVTPNKVVTVFTDDKQPFDLRVENTTSTATLKEIKGQQTFISTIQTTNTSGINWPNVAYIQNQGQIWLKINDRSALNDLQVFLAIENPNDAPGFNLWWSRHQPFEQTELGRTLSFILLMGFLGIILTVLWVWFKNIKLALKKRKSKGVE
jgi:hypothetical protein